MDDSSQQVVVVGKAHPGARPRAPQLRDPLPLELFVPTAPHRPGDAPRFEPFPNQPGDLPRPDTLASHDVLSEHAKGLIRVLADDGSAVGPWDPQLRPQQLRHGLEMMLRTRHFDARMIAMQRQGRLSFFLSSRGEEATAVAAAMAYAPQDMLFPSYRQPGLFLVRGMPLLALMCQSIGNRFDNTKGRQMPVHYSWRASNVVSISSPVGTQFPQAVGAAMAFAYRGERRVAGTWIGDGTASQGDFHYALNFASVFKPPCVLHVVDNQWAISTHRHLATGGATFADRTNSYCLPGLRVDGNDFLAVQAAEMWAIDRARRGGGPTLVELVTYRREAHSTSDDPAQYRAAGEADQWPGGDPVERLKQHLIGLGEWSEESHRDLEAGLGKEAAASFQHAETFGSQAQGLGHPPDSLFDDVFATLPPHLRDQLNELKSTQLDDVEEGTILPFNDRKKRAG